MALKANLLPYHHHLSVSSSSSLHSSSVGPPCAALPSPSLGLGGGKHGDRQQQQQQKYLGSGLPPLRKRLLFCHHHSSLSSSRRLFLTSVSGIWDAFLTGGNSASIAVRRGMQLFRQGDVHGSLVEFDKAIELDPRQKAYLWQRGLSLYYLDRFEEGAEQFRLDVAANPNDTEESIWCFLCEAQSYGADEARKKFLEVGRDPRPVMREAYNMFKDGGDPDKFVSAFLNGQQHEYFYASLYAGLYHESQNNPDAAKFHLVAACQSPYGLRSDDYMASLAKVHCLCRNWCHS